MSIAADRARIQRRDREFERRQFGMRVDDSARDLALMIRDGKRRPPKRRRN